MKSIVSDLRMNLAHYRVLLLRLSVAIIFMVVARIMFYIYNISFFQPLSVSEMLTILWGGFRFDLTALLYMNVLFIFVSIVPHPWRGHSGYERVLKILFLVVNGLILAINLADTVYYRFTLRRTTWDIFTQFENETNMFSLSFRFLIDYWYMVLLVIALIWLMVRLYNRVKPVRDVSISRPIVYYGIGIVLIPLAVLLFVGGGRGGFRHSTRPITLSNAGAYVSHPEDANIVLNTPFSLFRTIGKTKIKKMNYFSSEEEVSEIFSPIHPADTTGFKPLNVVVIILESFSKEFFGFYNHDRENGTYKGYTPFLDSLLAHSRTFEYSMANGRKSIDGLPSVLCSIPSLGVPYVLTPFGNNKVNSLGSLLKAKGYHTSFFHGAPNGSMGFDAFSNLAGFEHYYGMTEYGNNADFDGIWGIWDDKFFNFYADELNTFPEPFMSAIFSVSSHHPFAIPDEFKDEFKGGPLVIHKCVQYTDYSLRKFFNKVSSMPWFKNTLFVITADHVSSEIQFDDDKTLSGFYSIPVVFYRPDNSLAGMDSTMAQQIDIMPTVLGMIHYDKPYIAFGRNLLENSKPYVINYNSAYQYFEDQYLLVFDGEVSAGLYNYHQDKMSLHDLRKELPEVTRRMEKKAKAIVQQYNNRMVDNRMTVGTAVPVTAK